MLITCPHCLAKFNLPDDQITEDTRLRCSFCNTVFSLQESPTEEASTTQQQEPLLVTVEEDSKDDSTPIEEFPQEASSQEIPSLPTSPQKKSKGVSLIAFIFLILFAIAGVWVFLAQSKKDEIQESKKEDSARLLQEQINDLSIQEYRQYFIVKNPNIKTPFFVVEGKIKNNSKESKAFIVVKASLFNDKGEMIVEQEALAGVGLSLFQLQTMKEEDMIDMLKDPLEIAVTNSNVLPQNEVPFMLLFFNPPREVTEFSVQIVSASKAQELS